MMQQERCQRAEGRPIASTAYDTAWVAAVPDPIERRDPRFPSALSWIAANQLPDGSWGSQIRYEHDRTICTLAALIALARFGRRAEDQLRLRRGERYLWQHAYRLRHEPCELVGFELLLPGLLHAAVEAGIHVPPFLDTYAAERSIKLSLLPKDLLYSPHVTVAHSLEFLGDDVDPLQLLKAQAANGSVGNSPAATAFLLHHVDDPAAARYLEECLGKGDGTGVPVLDPCETFEMLWVAYHRFLGGVPADHLLSPSLRQDLARAVANEGVCLSPSFPIADADDTAVAMLLLEEHGLRASSAALQGFERPDYFVSFPYERHPSTGVNIHALAALTRCPAYPNHDGAIAKVLSFLDAARVHGTYWFDKWHISPYYATGHAVVALSETPWEHAGRTRPMVEAAVEWLLETQNEDGSWGFYETPTAEETAYALLALRHAASGDIRIAASAAAGLDFLAMSTRLTRPALWIDKCLYYPHTIVTAAIEAAQRCWLPQETVLTSAALCPYAGKGDPLWLIT